MAALSAACAALICSALAQQPPPSKTKKEEAVLRSTSRLVLVSVIVRDKGGAPIAGLTRDDFVVLDKGQPQSVAVFSSVAPGGAPQALAARDVPPPPPDTFSNRELRRSEPPTNVSVILFDMLNTPARDTIYGRQQVIRFLEQLRPQDCVALYVLSSRGVHVLHEFATDPQPLLSALGRYRAKEEPQLSASDPESTLSGFKELDDIFRSTSQLESGFYLRDRARRTVDALVAIANHLMRVPGRKNLIWVSGSFPIAYGFERLYASQRGAMAGVDASSASSADGLSQGQQSSSSGGGARTRGGQRLASNPFSSEDPDLMLPREQGVFVQDMERAARALNQANLAIYPVDPRGLVAPFPNPKFDPVAVAKGQGPTAPEFTKGGPSRKEFDTMNVLAERTGGRAFYNANEIYQSVREAIDESRVTYELGYYPTHNDWDGKFREITVRVKRPGVEVRHRRGYFAVADPPADKSNQAELLQTAAESPLESTVLGLRVRLESVAGAVPGTLNVRMELDTREISLVRQGNRWVGALGVLIGQRKLEGGIVKSTAQNVDLRLEPATYDKLLRDGMKLSKRIQLDPSAEELRIVVRDASSGTTGSVFVSLNGFRAAQP